MRYLMLGIAIVLFLIPSVQPLEISEYNITFDILPDGRVNEQVSMDFRERLNASTLNYVVLGDISDLRISSDMGEIDYVLERTGNEHNVKFVVPEGTKMIVITFTAKDLVFTRDSIYSFSTNLQPPDSERVKLTAFLPRGFAIYSDVVYPGDNEVLTDGERIYLEWILENPEEIAISFKYYSMHSDYSLAVFLVMALAIVLTASYLVFHYRKRVRTEFLRGFTEDERRVLKALSERNVCMQKALEKQFGFSRAKMTRIVKKLEGKGLVERERVGRTNRLFYRK
ncbi:MAG: MarR family transcriptional regulator [Candidatus Aenigmarchaeota archaeon]|nr:MarR family transcriptional regulator [Candidatus Aenigmarchaeota archaeon]NIP40523.1 MarR family transcriptional regulator [Candidatus Aenigmarchaeota archaeon]NIQ18368.1 MarR family transcriptional regulator [Candidatus Aenigmarchaeota archaeon]